MLVYTKEFSFETRSRIDVVINKWVDKTQNTILDIKLLDNDSNFIIVLFIPPIEDELERMFGLEGDGLSEGKSGVNVLDLSEFKDSDPNIPDTPA